MHFYSKTAAIIEWPFDLTATIEELVSWSIFLRSCDPKKPKELLSEAGVIYFMNFYSTY